MSSNLFKPVWPLCIVFCCFSHICVKEKEISELLKPAHFHIFPSIQLSDVNIESIEKSCIGMILCIALLAHY